MMQAYRSGRYYPGYAWVIVGVDVDNLLLNSTNSNMVAENCTLDAIKRVLNYSLAVEPAVSRDTKVIYIVYNSLMVL